MRKAAPEVQQELVLLGAGLAFTAGLGGQGHRTSPQTEPLCDHDGPKRKQDRELV